MKKLNLATLILVMVVLTFCQTVFSQDSDLVDDRGQQKRCNEFIKEVLFCVESAGISAEIGKSVVLYYSLENISDKEVELPNNRFGRLKLAMSDVKGNKIPSISETISEKTKTEQLTKEEQSYFISQLVACGHCEYTLAPKEVKKYRLYLDKFYRFNKADKYYVEITGKTPRNSQNSIMPLLAKISIEIK